MQFLSKLKFYLPKILCTILVGFLACELWYGANKVLETVSENGIKYGHDQGFSEGYKAGLDSANTKLLTDVSHILQVSLNERNTETIDEYILVEKRLHAIMDKSNDKLTKAQKREYTKYITKYAKKYDLSPILVAAIIHRESNFINKTTSSVGAIGPMQVWPKWHKEKMKKHKLNHEHLYSTNYGILMGCEILREYIDMEKGDFRAALYRYVGGKHHGYVKDIFRMCEYALKIKI